jgi:hypothetical protein
MTDGADDLMRRSVLQLPVLTPDRARAERVRACCHAALMARQSEGARSPHHAGLAALVLESALVGALSILYLAAVIHDVLRLRGVY